MTEQTEREAFEDPLKKLEWSNFIQWLARSKLHLHTNDERRLMFDAWQARAQQPIAQEPVLYVFGEEGDRITHPSQDTLDAARYRFIRDPNPLRKGYKVWFDYSKGYVGSGLDIAIDAAIAQSKES